MPKEDRENYSWHSFRRTLACALLAANQNTPRIQALCRWACPESVDAYAWLGPEEYMRSLRLAALSPSSLR